MKKLLCFTSAFIVILLAANKSMAQGAITPTAMIEISPCEDPATYEALNFKKRLQPVWSIYGKKWATIFEPDDHQLVFDTFSINDARHSRLLNILCGTQEQYFSIELKPYCREGWNCAPPVHPESVFSVMQVSGYTNYDRPAKVQAWVKLKYVDADDHDWQFRLTFWERVMGGEWKHLDTKLIRSKLADWQIINHEIMISPAMFNGQARTKEIMLELGVRSPETSVGIAKVAEVVLSGPHCYPDPLAPVYKCMDVR